MTGLLSSDIAAQVSAAIEILKDSRKAVALTGAGISTPSGIPDFRSPRSGVWEEVDPFEVASIYSFRRQPEVFYEWILPLGRLIRDAEANEAHEALAGMEQSKRLLGIITQNIDMLHHKAGSERVYELHGHMREMTCLTCYKVRPSEPFLESFLDDGRLPYCDSCGSILKPNLVLYGEQLLRNTLVHLLKELHIPIVLVEVPANEHSAVVAPG